MSANEITLTINNGKASRRTAHSSDRSSGSSDEDSSGTGVHVPSAADTGDYSDQESGDDSFTLLSKEEVGPSESASRLSSQPDPRSLQSRRRPREVEHSRRNNRLTRARRQPHHSPDESEVGSHEDLVYGEGPDPYHHQPRQRPASYHYPPHAGPPGPYGQGYGRGYEQYPPRAPPGDQLMRRNYSGFPMQPYQQPVSPPVAPPYYNAPHPGMHGMVPPMGAHHGYGQDMMGYMPPGMQGPMPQGYFPQVAQSPYPFQPSPQQIMFVPTPAPPTTSGTPANETPKAPPVVTTPPPPPEAQKDPGYEELKAMLIQERKDREAKEAKQKAEEEAKIKKAEDDKKKAEEIAAAANKAAAKAKSDAEKKAAEEKEAAAKQAAEEATKIKTEAEEAMAKAAAKAAEDAKAAKEAHDAALAAATAPPAEKQKPIRFKDAVGRKFNFPFHLCATWEGMEDLIKQAFLHVDVIGQHVSEGHYDLIGPNSEIILPAVWETVIEPDWAITMHMWPIPEPEPEPLPPLDMLPPLGPDFAAVNLDKGKKPGKKSKDKKAPPLPYNVEVIGGPAPPPPPMDPMAPPGAISDGPPGPKKKQPKSGGWSIFGSNPKPKAKPKAGPKKPV